MSWSRSLRGVEVLDSRTRNPVGRVIVLCVPWYVGAGTISNCPLDDLRSKGGKWGGMANGLIGISKRLGADWGVIALTRPDHMPPRPLKLTVMLE